MEKLLLRPDEAALALGVVRSRIYQLVAAGELPSVRIGHTVRIPADALRDWVNQRTQPRPSHDEELVTAGADNVAG